jgi:hypothetical protein
VKSETGFEPLLSFKVAWTIAGGWALLLDGDGLVGPHGRAEVTFLGVRDRFGDAVTGRVGCRLLEGGADNSNVYDFALVNFFAIGFDATL